MDDPYFEPVLARAVDLNVPIYLHPTIPPAAVIESCYGGFSDQVTFALATVGWGWHINTATHVLRMILGGVFDRHPTLQIIIGHMGEATSFMLPRFDATLRPELTGLRHPVSTYLRENLHYTFANFNDEATYANLVAQVGVDRVAFSTDYPFGSMKNARVFLDNLPLGGRRAGEHQPSQRRATAGSVTGHPFSEPVARTSVSLTASPCDRSSKKMGPPQDIAAERLTREDAGYHKALKNRQIQMIALGGAIGTGFSSAPEDGLRRRAPGCSSSTGSAAFSSS